MPGVPDADLASLLSGLPPSTSSHILPVAMQPGRSGEYAE